MTQADEFRTRLAAMSPAERTAMMVERIRSMPVAPYAEGGYVLRILEVAGRSSGEARSTPIAVVQLNDRHYLCAPNQTRDWVRNLRKAGTCRLSPDEADYRVSLVDAEEGAPVLDRYLGQLGRVSEEWPFEQGAALEDIAKHWDTMAVFRVEAF
ncbi:MAG TPA: hypothetical protein VGM75_25025 [Pseudonocardiaceae bacterium]|jgi:hypothetical protein